MYYNWEKNINTKELIEVCNKIKKGGIIIFPTETVYGIGANALDENAVKKIFVAKGRPSDNPLIVHVSNKNQIFDIAENISDIEQKLIDSFMPGPFTLILKKKKNIPTSVSAGLDTVGVRMPDNEIAKAIIENSNAPIAAPSANISGKPSGTTIEDIRKELENNVDFVIDGGKTKIGLESTVVKVINNIPTILRPGAVTPEQIKAIIGDVKIDSKVFEIVNKDDKVESPGMKYRHYAPKTKCKLIYSSSEQNQINEINNLVKIYKENVIILGFEEHKTKINISEDKFISLGNKNNLLQISRNIYSSLRKADKYNSQIILIEGVERKDLGIAIMNRLLRTCEYDYLEIRGVYENKNIFNKKC